MATFIVQPRDQLTVEDASESRRSKMGLEAEPEPEEDRDLDDDEQEEEDEEELEIQYEEACNEVAELEQELRAVEMESKQMRVRLQTTAAQALRAGHIPGAPGVLPPAAAAAAESRRVTELAVLLEWLARRVDLSSTEIFDVGYEVPVANRVVHLRGIAQWSLRNTGGGRLKISVPIEHQESISHLLAHIQARPGQKVELEVAKRFAAVWDLVSGELATGSDGGGGPEPAALLAHRGSNQGILVATWPTREAVSSFNISAACTSADVPAIGERVEVEYEGVWYSGLLCDVDADGKASLRCDADPEGVFTIASLVHVRRPQGSVSSVGPQQQQLYEKQLQQHQPQPQQPQLQQPQPQQQLPQTPPKAAVQQNGLDHPQLPVPPLPESKCQQPSVSQALHAQAHLLPPPIQTKPHPACDSPTCPRTPPRTMPHEAPHAALLGSGPGQWTPDSSSVSPLREHPGSSSQKAESNAAASTYSQESSFHNTSDEGGSSCSFTTPAKLPGHRRTRSSAL